jgi:hypothetical protein
MSYKQRTYDHLQHEYSYFSWSQDTSGTPMTVTTADTSILQKSTWPGAYAPAIVKTPDITIPGGSDANVADHDAVAFNTAGKYLIFFSGQFDATNLGGAGATDDLIIDLRVNGADVYTATAGVSSYRTHPSGHVILNISEGDVLTAHFDATGAASAQCIWFSIVGWKLNGDFGYARYLTNATAVNTSGGDVTHFLGGTDEGGTFSELLNNVTRKADTGKHTIVNDKTYMYLSTAAVSGATEGGSSAFEMKPSIAGSLVDSVHFYGGPENTSDAQTNNPLLHSYSLVRDLTNGQLATHRLVLPIEVTTAQILASGSAYSVIDIGHSDGTARTSYLAFSTYNVSNDMGDGANILDADNYSDNGTFKIIRNGVQIDTPPAVITAGDISFTKATGTFSVGAAGKYLFIIHLSCRNVQSEGSGVVGTDMELIVNKNGSAFYTFGNNIANLEDPETTSVWFILDLKQNDSITYTVNDSHDFEVDDGSSFTVIRVDERPDFIAEELGEKLIKDDNEINVNHKQDQFNRVVEQAPFRLNLGGPLNLRGRLTGGAAAISSGTKTKE